ncbi:MAG: DsbA family protein [Acidobacteriota bacterium]|nr:DsbA family protein [Acidobacteriota bacterium]
MHLLSLVLPALLLTISAPAADVPAFRVSGSPNAPVTLEVYTDFQCPHCREFYLVVLPQLRTEFIDTGKVRFIHRDFRISQFQFSKLAARYANAAGEVGKYDAVCDRLFETQPEWSHSGNVDAEVAKVLSPAEMEKVREKVKNDPRLEDQTLKDEEMARDVDHIAATPTVVIIVKGKREPVSGAVNFTLLKSYINEKLGK